jgi:hypothetical protein
MNRLIDYHDKFKAEAHQELYQTDLKGEEVHQGRISLVHQKGFKRSYALSHNKSSYDRRPYKDFI